MSLRRLSRNAFSSSAMIIVGAGLLFELYRFLAYTIGVEQIGVWSLVLASAGIVRLAELGMTGGLVKFIAGDLGSQRKGRAANTLLMGTSVIAITVGLACFTLWPVVQWLIRRTVHDPHLLATALGLLPWVLGAAWLTSLVNALAAALDGCQRTDLRAMSMVCGNAVQLALVYAFVPAHGLAALGPIQSGFVAIQMVLLCLSVFRVARLGGWGVPVWERVRLNELFRYGAAFQLTAIGHLLFEPTVRWFLGAFAGLAITGYYEMASRAVIQLRQVVVAAYQMLVPYLSARFSQAGNNRQQTRASYERVMPFMWLTAVPYFALIAAGLPFLLTVWSGGYSDQFVRIGLICLMGWFVSTLAVPAFMIYLSVGRLRWVAMNQLVIGILNLILGWLGGHLFGGQGVVIGAMLALAAGTMVVIVQFHREYQVSLVSTLPGGLLRLIAISLTGVAGLLYYALHWQGRGMPHWLAGVGYLTLVAVLLAFTWQHPLRQALTSRITLSAHPGQP